MSDVGYRKLLRCIFSTMNHFLKMAFWCVTLPLTAPSMWQRAICCRLYWLVLSMWGAQQTQKRWLVVWDDGEQKKQASIKKHSRLKSTPSWIIEWRCSTLEPWWVHLSWNFEGKVTNLRHSSTHKRKMWDEYSLTIVWVWLCFLERKIWTVF